MAKSNLLKGNSPDIVDANVKTLMASGKHSHSSALRCALCHANKSNKGAMNRVAAKVVAKPKTKLR